MRHWLGVLVFVTGCASWTITFQPAESPSPGRAKVGPIDVFLYAPPARPYVAVGLIQVESPSSRPTLDELVAHALEQAREVGCDLLVLRSLHRAWLRPILVAQRIDPTGLPGPVTFGGSERAPRRGDFICGVYTR